MAIGAAVATAAPGTMAAEPAAPAPAGPDRPAGSGVSDGSRVVGGWVTSSGRSEAAARSTASRWCALPRSWNRAQTKKAANIRATAAIAGSDLSAGPIPSQSVICGLSGISTTRTTYMFASSPRLRATYVTIHRREIAARMMPTAKNGYT